jgi:hypothetical protein
MVAAQAFQNNGDQIFGRLTYKCRSADTTDRLIVSSTMTPKSSLTSSFHPPGVDGLQEPGATHLGDLGPKRHHMIGVWHLKEWPTE